MGQIIVSGAGRSTKPSPIPIGTVWLYEEDGTFTVPANGTYQVEMHGGGGGGVCGDMNGDYNGTKYASGGGSGELYTVELTKGSVITVTVGAGGKGNVSAQYTSGNDGGTTTFGDLSVAGGGGGVTLSSSTKGGAASGSLATAGGGGTSTVAGGEGNINNTAQTYGDGGPGVRDSSSVNGKSGAVIITYMGVS